MTTQKRNILKHLMRLHIVDTPLFAGYLEKHGVSRNLQQYYVRSGWLSRVGRGAFIFPDDNLDWQGVTYSLQTQLKLPLHVGGSSALELQGQRHFLRLENSAYLFSSVPLKIPSWIKINPVSANLRLNYTNFLSAPKLGLTKVKYKTYELLVSTPERAILETLYLTPKFIDYTETYQLLEGLASLRGELLQELLGTCGSIKVKRLFLLLAGKTGHAWVKHLAPEKLSLGVGVRSSGGGGVYHRDYRITVPKELQNLWS